MMYQVTDFLFKVPCQVFCGVCNVPYDCPTLSISTSVSLRYIRGGWWHNGLGVCLACRHGRRSWVRVPRQHIPRFFFFFVGVFTVRSRFMLSKFNCNLLKTVPFIDPNVNKLFYKAFWLSLVLLFTNCVLNISAFLLFFLFVCKRCSSLLFPCF